MFTRRHERREEAGGEGGRAIGRGRRGEGEERKERRWEGKEVRTQTPSPIARGFKPGVGSAVVAPGFVWERCSVWARGRRGGWEWGGKAGKVWSRGKLSCERLRVAGLET